MKTHRATCGPFCRPASRLCWSRAQARARSADDHASAAPRHDAAPAPATASATAPVCTGVSRQPRVATSRTTITARASPILIAGSKSSTRRPTQAVGEGRERGRRSRVSKRCRSRVAEAAAHAAVELRALRRAGEGRHALLLHAQRRHAEPERAVRLGRPGFERQAVLFDPNTASRDATVALAEYMPSPEGERRRLRAVGRRHGLADLEVPPRRPTADGPAGQARARRSSGACRGRAMAPASTTAAIRAPGEPADTRATMRAGPTSISTSSASRRRRIGSSTR